MVSEPNDPTIYTLPEASVVTAVTWSTPVKEPPALFAHKHPWATADEFMDKEKKKKVRKNKEYRICQNLLQRKFTCFWRKCLKHQFQARNPTQLLRLLYILFQTKKDHLIPEKYPPTALTSVAFINQIIKIKN